MLVLALSLDLVDLSVGFVTVSAVLPLDLDISVVSVSSVLPLDLDLFVGRAMEGHFGVRL